MHNHQSLLDIFGNFNFSQVYGLTAGVGKSSIIYMFPFGPALWLSNSVFVNRKDAKASFKSLEKLQHSLTEKKLKIMFYPEGRRNQSEGFLPFKKGAFLSAIKAQVPILPAVFAPLSFIDHEKGIFLTSKSKYYCILINFLVLKWSPAKVVLSTSSPNFAPAKLINIK